MTTNGTQQNKLLWWITGSILAPLMLGSAMQMLHTVYADAQRLSALEVEAQDCRRQLIRIEGKLDRLLEK